MEKFVNISSDPMTNELTPEPQRHLVTSPPHTRVLLKPSIHPVPRQNVTINIYFVVCLT